MTTEQIIQTAVRTAIRILQREEAHNALSDSKSKEETYLREAFSANGKKSLGWDSRPMLDRKIGLTMGRFPTKMEAVKAKQRFQKFIRKLLETTRNNPEQLKHWTEQWLKD